MREVVSVHVGQAGVQIGKFENILSRAHKRNISTNRL